MSITNSEEEVITILTNNSKTMANILNQIFLKPSVSLIKKGIGLTIKEISKESQKIIEDKYSNIITVDKLAEKGILTNINPKNYNFIKTEKDAVNYLNIVAKKLKKLNINIAIKENDNGNHILIINQKNLNMLDLYTPEIKKEIKEFNKELTKDKKFLEKLESNIIERTHEKTERISKKQREYTGREL